MNKTNLECTIHIGGNYLKMDGKALTPCNYKIIEIEGLEASDYEINIIANGQQHGGRVAGKRVEERPITIEFKYRGPIELETIRDYLIGFFNPLKTGKLTVKRGKIERYIEVEISSFQIDKTGTRFQVIFECPNPFFKDVKEFSENMAGKIPMVRIPFIIPPSGYVASIRKFEDKMRIRNTGHKSVGMIIVIKANGEVLNPRLENLTTGEYMKVNTRMNTGDSMMINTNKGYTAITLNGTNISNLKDRGSRYLQLEEGDNILKYGADEGYLSMDIYPRYRPEYLGV